jgi:metallo-beta-lactamase family protein
MPIPHHHAVQSVPEWHGIFLQETQGEQHMGVSITFLGGAGTVTGSKYLVKHENQNLLVDCGLFQGYKQLRLRNWAPLNMAPNQIKAMLLTHAHLDHSGYLPLLVKEGFAGPVYATPATRDLCRILLPDSGHIQEEDAEFANRHKFTKHSPALPLYTRQDAVDALPLIKTVDFGKPFSPLPGWKATFSPAGHILGAASILLEVAERRILFSGDLGRPDDLIMSPPADAPTADTVLIESTYGDRIHPVENILLELAPALRRVAKRGGVAVVPVFAVGRAQALLHAIHLLKMKGDLPSSLPVFLDSPMAVHTTHLFEHHPGEHRLSRQDTHALTHCATMVNSTDESRALASRHGPMVILSASGMATGGRVLHHLAHYAGDHRNMIILTGYQAPGTRGDTLASGNKFVRIHGRDVEVNAEVVQLQSASAHADATQLLAWLRTMPQAPDQVYIVHGEAGPADTLRTRIRDELGWRAQVPEQGSTWST